jgi:hypothetical protein
MATTTNYGWTTPDDTALVKDGAAAIRTLGSSVDTTTKALNPSTTLGDIEYRSSTANTNTRLGIGTAGQVLTVNSGANAPEWTTIAAGAMTLISTTTLAGGSTSITSIPGTYKSLVLFMYDVNGNGGAVSVRPNGTSNICTGLAHENANGAVQSDAYASQAIQTRNSWKSGGTDNMITVIIDNYASSTAYKSFHLFGWYENTAPASNTANTTGGVLTNTAITSLTITAATAGTVELYGVK